MASRPIHIMRVAAHPADSFDMAGGTLAHHMAQGDRVTVVIATTGVRSHHWHLAEEKRKAGADLEMEQYVAQAVAEKLDEVRGACGILGFDYFMSPMAYMGNNSLEYAGTARADVYIDITDVIDKKVAALDQIASQYYGGTYARKRSETEDGAYGTTVRAAYAEQFQRFFPMVRYTLPVSDFELDKIAEPPGVMMGRLSEIVGGRMPLLTDSSFTSQYRVAKEKYDG